MNEWTYFCANLAAILVLVMGFYLPRHHRQDLALSYLVVNLGVLAVSAVLADSAIAAGLGLGLFGILSIIRLRSQELTQREIAYYFSSLAVGLIGGLGAFDGTVVPMVFMGIIVAAVAFFDARWKFGLGDSVVVRVDRAFTNASALKAHLETLYQVPVLSVSVQKVDLVDDSTMVRVWLRQQGGQR